MVSFQRDFLCHGSLMYRKLFHQTMASIPATTGCHPVNSAVIYNACQSTCWFLSCCHLCWESTTGTNMLILNKTEWRSELSVSADSPSSFVIEWDRKTGRGGRGYVTFLSSQHSNMSVISAELLVSVTLPLCVYFKMSRLESVNAVLLNQFMLDIL